MSSKLTLLESAFQKASEDINFLAFFLKKYQEVEKVEATALAKLLNCQSESYYKLGLCMAPDPADANYLTELNKICDYIGVPVLPLNQVIKRAVALVRFSGDGLNTTSVLMAARDKNKEE